MNYQDNKCEEHFIETKKRFKYDDTKMISIDNPFEESKPIKKIYDNSIIDYKKLISPKDIKNDDSILNDGIINNTLFPYNSFDIL